MEQEPSPESIEEMIVGFIVQQAAVDAESVDVEENVLTSGLIDSVAMMRMIADLEERLGVTVPAQDLVPENFRTIRVMAAYLSGLRRQ